MKSPELARLICGHICLHACMAGTRMAAPLLALRDGHSAMNVGILLALFALAPMFLALPAGRFADRRGMRLPVGISVVVAALGAGVAVVFPVFPVLCVSAFLTGGATGVASISLQRHVGRAAKGPTELKRVFSWLAIGPAVSNFIGPLAAGVMIDYAGSSAGDTSGYRGAFLVMALLPICTWFWIRRINDLAPIRSVAGAAPTRAWDLMREPMMRRLMLVNWCMASCWDVHMFAVPVIGHERGFDATVIGAILGAFAIAAALIRVVIPFVAARLQEHQVVTGAMLVTMLIFAAYPFMGSALAMGTCSVLLGLALGTVQPMVMSMLHQITPDTRHGEALGLRLMAINASSVAMPVVFGTLGAAVGVSALFWAVGVFVGLGSRQARLLRLDGREAHRHAG